MRRLLIVCLCVVTVGFVLLLLAGRARGPRDRVQPAAPDARMGDADLVDVVEDDGPAPAEGDLVVLAERTDHTPAPDRPSREAELALERLAQVRADVVAKVDRRPLFVMAHDRGLPNHELFTMTSEQLLDAILEAEGLPPADVLPSPQTEQQVMTVAAEAHRRHEQFLAEEAAERDAG